MNQGDLIPNKAHSRLPASLTEMHRVLRQPRLWNRVLMNAYEAQLNIVLIVHYKVFASHAHYYGSIFSSLIGHARIKVAGCELQSVLE